MVFDRQLKYVRSIPLDFGIGDFQVIDDGFFANAHRTGPGGKFVPLHVMSAKGSVVRSMGVDTFPLRELHRFLTAPSPAGIWANQYPTHRFERWSTDGTLRLAIDTRPSWFYLMPRGRLAPFTTVRSFREVDGTLWVMSWVPSPRIEEIVQEATGRRSGASENGPRLPVERMYSIVIEAYDARTGALIAEKAVNMLGTHFVDDTRFVVYSVNKDDLAQLELWEMKLKR
jgi:hypothetical protein